MPARLVFAALLLVCLLPVSSWAAGLKLAVVLSEQGGGYLEYSNALAGLLQDKNVTMRVIDAGQSLPEADLVIAAGMKASIEVARAQPAAMLAVLVPKEGVGKLESDYPALLNGGNHIFSAVYLDQPVKRQLDLILAALPGIHSIGVLYSEPPGELAALRKIAGAKKLELHEQSTTSFANLFVSLQTLLLSSDVLLALPDTEVYNASTIRNILLATYRNKVPLIGISPGYVKAGALCAVFSTPKQIAEQSANLVLEFIGSHTLPAAQYAKQFDVLVNAQVARSLGLNIRSASEVRDEIGAVP